MTSLYPGFEDFENYYKSDSVRVNSTMEKNKMIIVSIRNRFTNAYGKTTEKDISLMFQRDSAGQLRIMDSKGLSGFDEEDDYIFGVGTGCIDKNRDTTDQQILKAMKKSKDVMLDKAFDVYLELKSQVRIVNWSWESGYGRSASGQGS